MTMLYEVMANRSHFAHQGGFGAYGGSKVTTLPRTAAVQPTDAELGFATLLDIAESDMAEAVCIDDAELLRIYHDLAH